MSQKSGRSKISGWYDTETPDGGKGAGGFIDLDTWYRKRHLLNYRTVPVEIPGRMLMALGRLAGKEGLEFSDFVERILAEFLNEHGIDWRQEENES
jgi:hypothetical protein